MTESLKTVLKLFSSCGLKKKKDESGADVSNLSARLDLVLRDLTAISSAGIEDRDAPQPKSAPEDPSDWTPAAHRHLLKDKPPSTGPPPAERPLSDFALIEDDTDVAMAAFCFLTDIERLVNYVEEAWKACAANEIALVTATVLTTESVELVKTLEEGLTAGRGSAAGTTRKSSKLCLDSRFPACRVSTPSAFSRPPRRTTCRTFSP